MAKPISYSIEHFEDINIDQLESIEVYPQADGIHYDVFQDGVKHIVRIVKLDSAKKTFEIAIDGIKLNGEGSTELDMLVKKLGFNEALTQSVKEIMAPMPGLVLDIKANIGDEVAAGDPLLVLEAMKMENVIKSPGEGVIKSINVKSSEAVDKGQILLEFE